jgi:tRNA(Ile)-lysidine synthase
VLLSALAPALLARSHFPPPGAALDVAVSGGRDSLALLALGVAAGCEVTAYHVDHGLRPGSAEEAGVVAAAAARLGAAFVSLTAPCEPGPNLEARARTARFAVLPAGAATGHTADDQAETVLLNLLRGAGLDGLSGMRPGPRHPILELRRAEAAQFVDSLDFEVVADPSNSDPAYRRNRVRLELLPLLEEISARDLVPLLCRQAAILSDERDLLDHLATAVDPEDIAALSGAPLPLQRRALRRWLTRDSSGGYPPDAAALERVLEVARGDVIACELPGGRRVRRSHGRLQLTSPLAKERR